jgi:hypothetical protein
MIEHWPAIRCALGALGCLELWLIIPIVAMVWTFCDPPKQDAKN